MRKPAIEALESRDTPSTMLIFDPSATYPHHVVAIVETDLRGQDALAWAGEHFGNNSLGIRWIQDGEDYRDAMRIDSDGDGLQNDSIPFVRYDSDSNSWRDSSKADPLRVFIETPAQGISLNEQRAALDDVIAKFNAVEGADNLYLEQTYSAADASIIVGAFTQPAAGGRFVIAHAFQPTSNNFDGQLRIEVNNLAEFQVYDSSVRHRWDWQTPNFPGTVQKYEGPESGRYGFGQVVLHELTRSLGLNDQNALLPTATDPFYDPEWYSELQWQDQLDLADLY